MPAYKLKIDMPLFLGIFLLCAMSLVILYSAGGGDSNLIVKQSIRIGIALLMMVIVAQFSTASYQRISPQIYVVGLMMLIAVLGMGIVGKGAQRWLDFGICTLFNPQKLMKLAVPMMVAWAATRRFCLCLFGIY